MPTSKTRTAELPANVDYVRQLLSDNGPMTAAEIHEALLEDGRILNAALIEDLADRWGDTFCRLSDGRVAITRPVAAREGAWGDDEEPEGDWWLRAVSYPTVVADEVLVVSVETSPGDRGEPYITRIECCALSGGPVTFLEIDELVGRSVPERLRGVPLVEAMSQLEGLLKESKALMAWRPELVVVPALVAAAERCGRLWDPGLPVLDVYELSLLVDPTMVDRAPAAEAGPGEQEKAPGDDAACTLVAEVARALLRQYDPTHPNWALTWRCLAESNNAWASLLPPPSIKIDLEEALAPCRDILCQPSQAEVVRPPTVLGTGDAFRELPQILPGFRSRTGQVEMAHAVAGALEMGGNLAVEAPTGTGKSLSYLVPSALRAGHGPVVIATATKVLQRQLRDEAAQLRSVGLLREPYRQIYGVSNYLCTREIADALKAKELKGREWTALLVAVRGLATSPGGVWDDIAGDGLLSNDLRYRGERQTLRTSVNGCDRTACAWVAQCPLFMRLQGVDKRPGVLAVNHAVVASWVKVVSKGGQSPGDVLGGATTSIVFDEAHDLEESLTSAWTDTVSASSLAGLIASIFGRWGPVRLLRRVAKETGGDPTQEEGVSVSEAAGKQLLDDLGLAAQVYLHEFGGRGRQAVLQTRAVRTRPEYRALVGSAMAMRAYLSRLSTRLSAALVAGGAGTGELTSGARLRYVARKKATTAINDISEAIEGLDRLRDLPDPQLMVHILLASGNGPLEAKDTWEFNSVPIDIGARFHSDVVGRVRSVVLTSATLTVNQSLSFLARRLGISVGDEPGAFELLRVDGPFDYTKQSLLLLTSHLPTPVPSLEDEFCEELASDLVGFTSLSGGRVLALFAARRRMNKVAELYRRQALPLSERGVELLVQGEGSPATLIEEFRSKPGTVLFGVRSYWQGFDAPGETLSYLYIEKPPYPHPDDAIASARQRSIADAGGDPFLDYVVPKTAIQLAQGFGRLIRSEQDRGVAILADRRLQLPSQANNILLGAIPTRNVERLDEQSDTWERAIEFVTGRKPDVSSAISLALDDVNALLSELVIAVGEDPVDKLRRAAKVVFAIDELRPQQLELMKAVLDGKDALGLLPTGFGKSLCFQLPALLRADRLPTVVVSPLVALIKDQVDELRSRRRIRSVRGLTGATPAAERTEVLRDLTRGRIRVLYLSPERLVRDNSLFAALAAQDLGSLVVDEAHCISSWGYDFRPEFRLIAKSLVGLGDTSKLALTATAPPQVEADLTATLQLNSPIVVRTPVNRPDLRYWVRHVSSERERTRDLLRFIAHQGGKVGIVYATRRATTEELAWIIRQTGMTARSYHAGMVPEQREAVQDDYLAGTTQVIVATKAFGMGVNKPDIGWVVHYDLPESVESYAQETGRAARLSHMSGDCVMYVSERDVARQRRQVGRVNVAGDAEVAQRLLDLVASSEHRAEDRIFDPEVVAEKLMVDVDQLNVCLSWLEQAGALDRGRDATVRAALTVGVLEPEEAAERRRFFYLVKHVLNANIGVRRIFNLAEVASSAGRPADELERDLQAWSLQRLVVFEPTKRAWRVHVKMATVARVALIEVARKWRSMQRARLDEVVSYAYSGECRREVIARCFGDPSIRCLPGDPLACDVCNGGEPYWYDVPLDRVADPEQLVDAELVALQAVRWTSRYTKGRYGEVSLRAAICGREVLGRDLPISPGLLSCPQFGALRYLRSADQKLDEAIASLIGRGLLVRVKALHGERAYSALELTEAGRAVVGGPV